VSFAYIIRATGAVAHKLESYKGPCRNLHGHTIKAEVEFTHLGRTLPKDNMFVDFKKLKGILKAVIPDHVYLNELYETENPTAEFLAKRIYRDIERLLRKDEDLYVLEVESVTIWESEKAGVTYRE